MNQKEYSYEDLQLIVKDIKFLIRAISLDTHQEGEECVLGNIDIIKTLTDELSFRVNTIHKIKNKNL